MSALFVQFRLHQFLVRSVRCQSHATEMVAQRALRGDFGAPKAPRGPISESRNSPKRSRRAPGCTPAHRCGPGIPQTRLKSLRSEPGHVFPPLLGHLGPTPSLPAQVPYTVEDPLSLHPFASTAPHASPGSADFLARGHMRRPWKKMLTLATFVDRVEHVS